MKNKTRCLLAAVALGLWTVIAIQMDVKAGQVNPTSNVLADTAATANTIVLRDGNGELAAAVVTTAAIAPATITTIKLNLDQPISGVACITTAKLLGTCSGSVVSGKCNCS